VITHRSLFRGCKKYQRREEWWQQTPLSESNNHGGQLLYAVTYSCIPLYIAISASLCNVYENVDWKINWNCCNFSCITTVVFVSLHMHMLQFCKKYFACMREIWVRNCSAVKRVEHFACMSEIWILQWCMNIVFNLYEWQVLRIDETTLRRRTGTTRRSCEHKYEILLRLVGEVVSAQNSKLTRCASALRFAVDLLYFKELC